MKKLMILALSLTAIFLIPASAAAAEVNLGGELDFGKYLGTDKNICKAALTLTSPINDTTVATVDLSGNWAGNTRRKGVIVLEDATVAFKEKFGTFTFGYFKYDLTESELLDPDTLSELRDSESSSDDPSDSQLSASLNAPLTKEWNLLMVVAAPLGGLDYSAGISYDVTAFSAGITLCKYAANQDGSYIVNGSYTIKALKYYLTMQNYLQGNANTFSLILGANYDSAERPIYGQVEYDLASQAQSSHNFSVCLGYKINRGVKIEYNWTHQNANSGSDDHSLKMRVFF